MPLADPVGMGMAIDVLFNLLTAKPRLKGESHIQFNLMRWPCAMFTLVWDSSPAGIDKGATFTTGGMNVTITMCPTQQKWFGLFLRRAENRMGYISQCNQPLRPRVINKLLRAIKEEIEEQDTWIAREYVKVGAAAALAVCASLQRPEIFLFDLAGLWRYHDLGKNGILPEDSLKTGMDLSQAPYIIITLISKIKGVLGSKHHHIALLSLISSGIKLCWWIKQLMRVPKEEGCRMAPPLETRMDWLHQWQNTTMCCTFS
jgi:hypothetical protein